MRKTNESVAIKETYQNPRYANREGEMCKKFNHPNIVKFHAIYYEYKKGDKYLVLVMDYYSNNLQKIIDIRRKRKQYFKNRQLQAIGSQLASALEHMHSFNIAHRDIKPDNILVNMQEGKVVIADLGSAKDVLEGYNKSYICSRVYRAPELVLECEHYTPSIDMWSLGCVLAECALLKTLFHASSQEELFILMQTLFGDLTQSEIQKLRNGQIKRGVPVQHKISNPLDKLFKKNGVKSYFGLQNFLLCLLQWDPQIRISASDALQHIYFFQNSAEH